MKICDKNTLSIRSQNFINSWYLVEYSIKMSKIDIEHNEAFLMNATVMAVMTLEALLNDLTETYTSRDIFDCLDKEKTTLERFKKMIKALSGNMGEFMIDCQGGRFKKVKKTDIENFFNESKWSSICDLVHERNKIVHYKTEDEVIIIEYDKITEHKKVRNNWEVNYNETENLVMNMKTFLGQLKKLLSKSIDDYIPEQFSSRFNFLN